MTDPDRTMAQTAPFPEVLADLVAVLKYRPGWRFYLVGNHDRGQGSRGLTLVITCETVDSYPPHDPIKVNHFMPVPPAAYEVRSWRRWLFDQCLLVDRHEACEFFEIDGDKPYAPSHGPGNDPYMVREVGTDVDRRTSFRGVVS
jgi:hypothetical protein